MAADRIDPVEQWNTSGAVWVRHADEIDAHARPYGEAGIRALAPRAGERLLDLGCGPGATTFDLGHRVTAAGSVLGVDVSAPMLELAKQRLARSGLDHVSFVHADVATAPLADLAGGPADGAFSRFGVMFFVDPEAAFANVAAALRAGGRLSLVVWQPLACNPWWSVPTVAASELLDAPWAPPPPDQPGPFTLSEPERVRAVLAAAGFADVGVEGFSSAAVLRADSLDEDAGGLLRTGPMRSAWDGADEDARRAAVAAVRQAVAPYRDGDAYRLPGAVWVVTARRASSG
jgi:SAM-dependent methyltransferase